MKHDELNLIYAHLLAVETLAQAAAAAVSDRQALRKAFREFSEQRTVHFLNSSDSEIYLAEYQKKTSEMRTWLGDGK